MQEQLRQCLGSMMPPAEQNTLPLCLLDILLLRPLIMAMYSTMELGGHSQPWPGQPQGSDWLPGLAWLQLLVPCTVQPVSSRMCLLSSLPEGIVSCAHLELTGHRLALLCHLSGIMQPLVYACRAALSQMCCHHIHAVAPADTSKPLGGSGVTPSPSHDSLPNPGRMEQHALGDWGTSMLRSFTTLPGETKGSVLQDWERTKTKAHSSILELRRPERRRC